MEVPYCPTNVTKLDAWFRVYATFIGLRHDTKVITVLLNFAFNNHLLLVQILMVFWFYPVQRIVLHGILLLKQLLCHCLGLRRYSELFTQLHTPALRVGGQFVSTIIKCNNTDQFKTGFNLLIITRMKMQYKVNGKQDKHAERVERLCKKLPVLFSQRSAMQTKSMQSKYD